MKMKWLFIICLLLTSCEQSTMDCDAECKRREWNNLAACMYQNSQAKLRISTAEDEVLVLAQTIAELRGLILQYERTKKK